MDYKVSIVIPIYNVEKYIEKCLLSAFNQIFDSIEYLLIDDCGTDNGMHIVRKMVAEHPRGNHVRIITHDENKGVGVARNTGINEVKGEYFYFLDSDDIIPNYAIQQLYAMVTGANVDFVCGCYESVDYSNTGKKWLLRLNDELITGEFAVAKFFFNGQYNIEMWNKLYRLSFIKDNNIKCTSGYHEDIPFSLKAALSAKSIKTTSEITYYYSFREKSIMSGFTSKNATGYYDAVIELVNYSIKFKKTKIYPRIVYYIFGLRFSLLEQVTKSTSLDKGFKSTQLKNLRFKVLSIKEIWMFPRIKTIHRIKYSISFFNPTIQLYLLQLIKLFYKK